MNHPPNDPDPKRMFGPLWYGEQDENGIDMSIIYANLARTPTQRIRRANRAQRGLIRLRRDARRITPGERA